MYQITDRKIHKETVVGGSLQKVWAKWTTHQGLKTFFGGDNQVELWPGGKYEIYFLLDAVEGMRGGEGCKVLSFLPNEMLSFSWNAPPSIPDVRNHDHKAWVIVNLKALSPEQVHVSLHHIGWIEGPAWDEAFEYFEKVWDFVLENLKKSFEEE